MQSQTSGKGEHMRIGIPKEIKPWENRVALLPDACGELVSAGHQVLVQAGAGEGSGYADVAYEAAGAQIQPDAPALYAAAAMVVKVKEPLGDELDLLRADHLLFSYLHLAALPELTRRLCEIGVTAIGFETVADHGGLPLLAPMSDIAGRIAVQVGSHLLHGPEGGRGVLLGGLPGAPRGHVVVLGAGVAGGNAARLAAALGANVTVFDKDPNKLAHMHHLAANISTLYPNDQVIGQALRDADLVIGAVLVPGARTPHLVSRQQVASMPPGSVIVDIAVDQGGCVETTEPRTYDDPVYVVEGVSHFSVVNMPGAVARTASLALSGTLTPYVLRLASPEWEHWAPLAGAIYVRDGAVVLPALRGD